MFGFGVSFDTLYFLFIVLTYRLILDIFYVMFQCHRFGAFMVIVHKALVSLTSVLRPAILWTLRRQTSTDRVFNILG